MNGPNSPDDDRLDEMLIHAARDYNRPSDIPREEIWAKISEARHANASAAPQASIGKSTRRIWTAPGIGIAAALLISTGIVIGRRMQTNDRGTTQVAASQTSAATTTGGTTSGAANPTAAQPGASTRAQHDTLQEQLHQETRRTNDAAQALAAAPGSESASGPNENAESQRSRTLAYQLVVMRHLAGTEAMLTSFQQSARRGGRDSTMAQWSRELLGTTRTLEAARGTNDPVMRRLLDDLDLVLSQIVQYTTKGTYDAEELNLIDQSINRRGVMTKLRSTLPSRQSPAGT